jgi:serine/threonine-protein kinase
VLHPYWSEDQGFVDRFRQEARAVAQLRHPNVVTVYDAGEIEGQLYIAMEYLPGRTLGQLLEAERALGLEQALPVLEELARALDHAHRQGAVHRDVKPSNVMVEETADGLRVTLMDFGLVKAMSGSTALTSQGTLLGSPEYMAPEQADPGRADEIGPATDRYALGVVAYQMLTGQAPFPGNTPATLNAHLNLSPPDPRRVCANLSASVCRVLLKALSKSPRGRYATAMGMVDALRRTGVREARRSVPSALLWGLGVVLALIVCALVSSLGVAWLSKQWANVGTSTPTSTSTYTPKLTPTATATSTVASVPTETWTPEPTAKPTDTPLPIPAATKTPTEIPVPTSTNTPVPTATSTPEPTATATATIAPSPTPTPSAGATRVREKDGAVMVYVPAGEFWMGSSDEDIDAVMAEGSDCKRAWYTGEHPRHKVYVDAFWIDQTEVTNARYKKCVDAGACSPPVGSWTLTRDTYYGNPEFDDYPVVHVIWHQAQEYAEWVGGRLPTEAEWEYAARGPNGYIYPWGDGPPNNLLLNYNDAVGDTTAVGSYPDGASWCGALDMAGNVWEWTSSLHRRSPYDAADGREDLGAGNGRVSRGGTFYYPARYARCANRSPGPSIVYNDAGFRVVAPPL